MPEWYPLPGAGLSIPCPPWARPHQRIRLTSPCFPVTPVTSVLRPSGLAAEKLSPRKAGFEHFLLFSPFPVAFPRTTSLTSSSPGARWDAADVRAARRESHPGAHGLDSAFPGYQDKYSCGMTGLPAAGGAQRLFWVDPVLIFVEVGGQR